MSTKARTKLKQIFRSYLRTACIYSKNLLRDFDLSSQDARFDSRQVEMPHWLRTFLFHRSQCRNSITLSSSHTVPQPYSSRSPITIYAHLVHTQTFNNLRTKRTLNPLKHRGNYTTTYFSIYSLTHFVFVGYVLIRWTWYFRQLLRHYKTTYRNFQ
jgi:hypothetical protein